MLEKVTERIYYLPPSQETDRPTLGYIKGERYALMIDAGNSKEHVALFEKALVEMGLPLPDYVAITHWHWDHTFGMEAVKGKTITGVKTDMQLAKVSQWSWTDVAMAERLRTGEDIEFCDRCIRLEYPDRSRINVVRGEIVFEDRMILDLGGIHCELLQVGGPHSEDSVIMYIPEEKVLFVGDADCSDHYYNHGLYDPVKLEKMIQLLEGMDFETYVLGHDAPQGKDEVMAYLYEELGKVK